MFLLTTFAALDLSDRLLETLAAEGYTTPTPIQARAIPPALAGRDLLGSAQTGTGKTAAFALPLIDRLAAGPRPAGRRARALILAPTRELAAQIEESLRVYGRGAGLRHAIIYGGVKQARQVRQLASGADVVVATPGRLLDLMEQGHVDLSAIETFILDEADRMLDMGFIEPIRRIERELPRERQTLFFSATMPPKIRRLADAMLRDPVAVAVASDKTNAPAISQTLYHIQSERKPALLARLLGDAAATRSVVFTKTKHGAEKLAKKLARSGMTAGAIHGNKTQGQRQRALDAFRSGRTSVLVATDVAARGLDVDGVTHVFNYNLPMEPEAYIHRIGRTGRAGAAGQAVSFCGPEERGLLRAVERLTGRRIETARIPDGLEPAEREEPRPRRDPAERSEIPARKPRRKPGARPAAAGQSRAPKPKRKKVDPQKAHAPGGHAKSNRPAGKKKTRRTVSRRR